MITVEYKDIIVFLVFIVEVLGIVILATYR